eukprot:1137934-Pelagomonas_calceolata.AAC.1
MLSSLICIQNTDLDMPKQATTPTIRAYYLMLRRRSAMPKETCPVYPLSLVTEGACAILLPESYHHDMISSVKPEHHNVAGRMIATALSKCPWGAGLVDTDIGSDDRLAQHNLQIPAHVSHGKEKKSLRNEPMCLLFLN